jgi:hypothetical protein
MVIFVPVLGVAVARRRYALRPALRLERSRLVAAGVTPSRRDLLRAMLALYSIVGYVAGVARVRGRLEGRRLARRRQQGLDGPGSRA